ncbi:MAG TPA: ATP-binding cassette domain-containing protein [Gemmatimonadaceae bacterium]|nr:ATP-binding cassette domain-containing protein [Gemmatimonadaceae bacterium]
MISLSEITHRVGNTQIIDDVSVRFSPGAFNVILGPNGAGKTTLLKIATGLLRPTAGDVRYDDAPLSHIAPSRLAKQRAVLSQTVDLAFALSVRDVALMGRYPYYGRVPATTDLAIVDRALELVGLSNKRDQAYPTLSAGEKQKTQLARVLAQIWNYDDAGEHRYLFLDEPTSSLDLHYQMQILDLARGLLRHNCTVIAILHDLNVASEYGNHFIVLDQGRVAAEVDDADHLSVDLIDRVFRVRSYRVPDSVKGLAVWRFR